MKNISKTSNECVLKYWSPSFDAFQKAAGNPVLQAKILSRYIDLRTECEREKGCNGCGLCNGICETDLKLEPKTVSKEPQPTTFEVLLEQKLIPAAQKVVELRDSGTDVNALRDGFAWTTKKELGMFIKRERLLDWAYWLIDHGFFSQEDWEQVSAEDEELRKKAERQYEDKWLEYYGFETSIDDFVVKRLREVLK